MTYLVISEKTATGYSAYGPGEDFVVFIFFSPNFSASLRLRVEKPF